MPRHRREAFKMFEPTMMARRKEKEGVEYPEKPVSIVPCSDDIPTNQ